MYIIHNMYIAEKLLLHTVFCRIKIIKTDSVFFCELEHLCTSFPNLINLNFQ